MIDAKWEEDVMAMSKHKLLEVIECLNKQSKYYANDVETIKNAYKALYYLLSIEKLREALQKPLLPSRMEQKCSVQFFLTTPGGAVFLPT